MPQTREALVARLAALTEPGARGRLVARGLARGFVWKRGRLPIGVPGASPNLTADLLDHGYNVLGQALRLRDLDSAGIGTARETDPVATRAFIVAAESIESAVRKGPLTPERDFHLVVAACAYHLAHLAARSYCLVPDARSAAAEGPIEDPGEEVDVATAEPSAGGLAAVPAGPNLATPERLLVALMRRELGLLGELCARWLRDPAHQDARLAARLADPDDPFDVPDAEEVALTATFVRATGALLAALERGEAAAIELALARYQEGAVAAGGRGYISLWWAHTLARHLAEELWGDSLHVRLPVRLPGPLAPGESERWAVLRDQFLTVLRARTMAQVDLWPSQREAAARAVDPTDDLVAALPTSAGKTRIAEFCILRTLAQGRRVVYVTPLRALSAQLERTLGRTFRPLGHSVTALYGASGVAAADVATLADADIVVATPEKLDFALRTDPAVLDSVGLVVLDEGHMIGTDTREIRYEVLVQRLLRRADASQRRIVCLSAIFTAGPAFDDFVAWIRDDAPGTALRSDWRPTRQRNGVLVWTESGGRLALSVDEETPFVPRFVPEEPPGGRRSLAFPRSDEELTIAAAKAFAADGQRVLVYCPLRKSVESLAKLCLTLHRQGHLPNLLPEEAEVGRAVRVGTEWLGADHVAVRALELGIGVHHAHLPRPFLSEVEELLTKRQLTLVVASPTLAQGIDLSCGVLIFRSIMRGRETITPSEFANVRGRAGRAYVDLDGLTLLPVYEGNPARRRRLEAYAGLERAARERSLESGLVQLVESLARQLARALGVEVERLLEYVTNASTADGSGGDTALDWPALAARLAELDAERRAVAGADGSAPGDTGQDAAESFPHQLADLDTAILSLIEDLDASPDALAAGLDAALAGSLWARRLARHGAAETEVATAVVRDRARWLWARTTATQRRGYFAAGIGYDAGQYLDAHLEELLAGIAETERVLAAGLPDESLDALVTVARRLGSADPFRFEHAGPEASRPELREGWPAVLRTWIRGASLPGTVADPRDLAEAVAFVQGDVVYRLVWGIEAVRVHGQARGMLAATASEGTLALLLTYGVPTRAAALLAQAGLTSRAMVMRLTRDFPATFADPAGMGTWIVTTAAAIRARGLLAYWPDPYDQELWREFAAPWTENGRSERWAEQPAEAEVRWTRATGAPYTESSTSSDARPPAGTVLRVVHDGKSGMTYACNDELSTVGQLVTPLPTAGSTPAVVLDGHRLRLIGFGPRKNPS